MGPFSWTVATTVGISLIAWIGVFTLFLRDELVDRLLLVLVALAAGGLIGGAFLHLLPQAIADAGSQDTFSLFLWFIGGFCLFFALEQFIHWHHHHAVTHEHEPVSYLVLLSDTLHNFIDGLVVAAAFLSSVPLGLVTAAAIALHEIPQEIGDFGVLVYGGFDRRQALVLNYLTQSTVVLGGVVGAFLGGALTGVPTVLLPFAAGNFVYIASSDLIPEIKQETDLRRSVVYFAVFLTGIGLMLAVRFLRSVASRPDVF
ncbi:ZIP family metal transporter [Salinigranum halophilum]|jgi:zinc and cadmium transporter|uniref:ZIP family metal transporter n=1 Tax=Salinigranum halophilum TaxID=2565931 RepID=UPI00115CBA39|nr:ZIP family metal transporter [Salinigranum halophilum]